MYKFAYLVIALTTVLFCTRVFAHPSETLARMQARMACQAYGEDSDVCASAKRDITTGSSSETLARMQARMACQAYGEDCDVCASAKRDIYDAIARDGESYGSTQPNPVNRGYINPSPSFTQHEKQKNTITFTNQSGETALVKVRGATNTQTSVPNGSSSTVNASAGMHYILVRYGSNPPYTYSKGESFSVDETATQYSAITITLHKVAHGNYSSSSTSQAEFDSR